MTLRLFPDIANPERYNPDNAITLNAVIPTYLFRSGWILPSLLGLGPRIHPSGVGGALSGLGIQEIDDSGLYQSGLVHSEKIYRPVRNKSKSEIKLGNVLVLL